MNQAACTVDRHKMYVVDAGEGVITYMRTDGVQLAQEIIDGARAFVSQQYGPEYLPPQPRVYKCVIYVGCLNARHSAALALAWAY